MLRGGIAEAFCIQPLTKPCISTGNFVTIRMAILYNFEYKIVVKLVLIICIKMSSNVLLVLSINLS